jgi:hypothetical protein
MLKKITSTNQEVIQMWIDGRPAVNHRGTLEARPSGELYSYHLKIGQRVNGTAIVADYTARSGNFHSQTTSCHVNLAARFVHKGCLWHPDVWTFSPLGQEVIPF